MICPGKKCAKEIPDDAILCCYCGRKIKKKKSYRSHGNGIGSVYKRGDTYTAVAIVGWYKRASDGKKLPLKNTEGGFKSETDAFLFLPELRKRPHKLQRIKAEESITFLGVYETWLPTYEKKVEQGKRTKSTMMCYKAAIQHFIDIFYMPFKDVGVDDLQYCVDTCSGGKSTKHKMKALAKHMYEYGVPRHLSDMDYSAFLDISDGEQGKVIALPQEVIEIVRQNIGIVNYADMIYCLIYTGYRPTEMLTRRPEDYNPTQETVFGGIKTAAGKEKVMTLSPKVAPIFKKYAAKNEPFIFTKDGKNPMDAIYFLRSCFYPAFEQMGIQPAPKTGEKPLYVPYSCRHTFSNLIKNVPGADKDKAALMGHEDYQTTKKHYQDADIASMKAITDRI